MKLLFTVMVGGLVVTFGIPAYGASRSYESLHQNADRTISGRVIDESGLGLPGVSVVAVGTTVGTVTNVDGEYSLNIPEGAAKLSFSFIGYETKVVAIGEKDIIDINMTADVDVLAEVVITGYGQTQNKQLVSSAISTISPKEMIEDRPITRLEQVLQGSTPAVIVLQESGSPGAPLTVRMRGVGTANNAQPLMLMNGFQLPNMNHVNPADVGGIQVFKDAASAAIYGARGANGVINMQNKAGHNGDTEVTLSAYHGVQQLASTGDYLTTREYGEYYNNSLRWLINEGENITGFRPIFTDEELSLLPQDTWIERVSQDAAIQNYHVAIAGGNETTKYYLSGGYFDQGGIIGPTGFSRATMNLNLTTQLKENVELNLLSSFTSNKRNFINENSENSFLMSSVASLPAIYPMYSEDGDPFNNGRQGVELRYNGVLLNAIAEFGNPSLGFRHVDQRSVENTLFSNALIKWEVIDGLKVNASAGYFGQGYGSRGFAETFSYPAQGYSPRPNALWENSYDANRSQGEVYLSYDGKIGSEHSVSAILGASILHDEAWFTGRSVVDLAQNTFEDANFSNANDLDAAGISPDVFAEKNTLSYYSRLQYNFREKYLLDATMRVDGSSNFGPSNKYGYFPSVNAGWVVSEEPFLSSIGALSLVKLRASWGINGIDAIPPYKYVKTVQKQGNNFELQDYDPNIKWEEVSQTNFGLDVDLFKNKVGVTIDNYYKITTDMLVDVPVAAFTGLAPPVRNVGTVKNSGWEFMVMYREKIGEDLKFEVSANFGTVKNEVTDLGVGGPLIGGGTRVFQGAPLITRSDVGDPIASFYGFVFDGLDGSGNPIYRDLSGPEGEPDGLITEEDKTIIGSPYPDLIYGVNLSVDYKGFDFTAFISGVEGNDVVNASMGYGFAYSNRTSRVLNAWSHSNPNTNVIRPSATQVVNHEFSSYYIEDGSYVRLKNLTLGYTLPSSALSVIKMKSVRFYVSANNILTLTDYSGYDPEIGSNNDPRDVGIDRGFYPQARSFMGGFQLTF